MENQIGIDGFALREYLSKIRPAAHEQIVDMIFGNKALKNFFATPMGKRLGAHYVRTITDGITKIISIAFDDKNTKVKVEEIVEVGNRVKLAKDALNEIAEIMAQGETHIQNITNRNKKTED